MKKAYIETYGCSANQSHSEVMVSILKENGFEIVRDIDKSDVIIINTCIVKTPTENRMRTRVKFFVENYPEKKLVIAGCAADAERGMFKKIAPSAVFLSSHESKKIGRIILGKKARLPSKKIRFNPVIGIVEIASGCLGSCSYCITKLARGKLKSRNTDEIICEVENLVKDGCKEIWLTSQDNGCYGLDIGTNIVELLRSVVAVDGDFRIRLGMMNPAHLKNMIDDLVSILDNEKIYKFVHIPVQSGSNRILRLMKRGYAVGDFLRIVDVFRGTIPDLTISTDVIVGFPGETREDFEQTLKLLTKVKPDIVNISKFGSRPGTEAARMKQLDNKIVKQRSVYTVRITREIAEERNSRWIGKECVILVNEKGKRKNQFVGRNEYYKPVVVASKKNVMGNFVKVKITENLGTALLGEIKNLV